MLDAAKTTANRLRGGLWAAPALGAALMLALAVYAAPAAHAGDPPGDCWGGALSAHPTQCHALEEVQRDGLIEVSGIYRGGTSLYLYFTHADELTYDDLHGALEAKAIKYADTHPVRTYGRYYQPWCAPYDSESVEYRNCHIRKSFDDDYIMLWEGDYVQIRLRSGGIEARKSEGGWASWTQLWPKVEGASGQTGGAVGSVKSFDVSGVDFDNIPEIDCDSRVMSYAYSCPGSHETPGVVTVGSSATEEKSYLEFKVTSGTEAEAVAALKKWLLRRGRSEDYLARWTFIPVKYGFEDYWRWYVLLDRFAKSSGNTIGLRSVLVGVNGMNFADAMHTEAGPGAPIVPADARTTMILWAYDKDVAAAALPTLLPQLGIPLDAVGMVATSVDRVPEPAEPTPGEPEPYFDVPVARNLVSAVPDVISRHGSGATIAAIALAGGLTALVVLGAAWYFGLPFRRQRRGER